jgi:hypothetical protein
MVTRGCFSALVQDDTTGFEQVRFKPKQELAKATAGVESPYDVEARYAAAMESVGRGTWCT